MSRYKANIFYKYSKTNRLTVPTNDKTAAIVIPWFDTKTSHHTRIYSIQEQKTDQPLFDQLTRVCIRVPSRYFNLILVLYSCKGKMIT